MLHEPCKLCFGPHPKRLAATRYQLKNSSLSQHEVSVASFEELNWTHPSTDYLGVNSFLIVNSKSPLHVTSSVWDTKPHIQYICTESSGVIQLSLVNVKEWHFSHTFLRHSVHPSQSELSCVNPHPQPCSSLHLNVLNIFFSSWQLH